MLVDNPRVLMAIEKFVNKCVDNKIKELNDVNINVNGNDDSGSDNQNVERIEFQPKKGFDDSLSFGNLVCGFMRSTFLKDKSNIGKLFVVVGGHPIIFI